MKKVTEGERAASGNTMIHVFNFVIDCLALIYSFGVLYYIGANWLLWLIWFFLQFHIFFNLFVAIMTNNQRMKVEAEKIEEWKRETKEQLEREMIEHINFTLGNAEKF